MRDESWDFPLSLAWEPGSPEAREALGRATLARSKIDDFCDALALGELHALGALHPRPLGLRLHLRMQRHRVEASELMCYPLFDPEELALIMRLSKDRLAPSILNPASPDNQALRQTSGKLLSIEQNSVCAQARAWCETLHERAPRLAEALRLGLSRAMKTPTAQIMSIGIALPWPHNASQLAVGLGFPELGTAMEAAAIEHAAGSPRPLHGLAPSL